MNYNDVRSILKDVSGSGTAEISVQKSAKFDELNLLATFHPEGKTYGHMVIDEPKTPYVWEDDVPQELDTAELLVKLHRTSMSQTPAFGIDEDSDDSSDDEDFPESVEERVQRLLFERRRKLHYKEYFTVPMARRLIAEEFGELTSSEPSYKLESTPCSLETCSTETVISERTTMAEDSLQSAQSSSHNLLSDIKLEPGFEPNHHCYQKLMAEINSQPPVQEPAHVHRVSINSTIKPKPTNGTGSTTKKQKVPTSSSDK